MCLKVDCDGYGFCYQLVCFAIYCPIFCFVYFLDILLQLANYVSPLEGLGDMLFSPSVYLSVCL